MLVGLFAGASSGAAGSIGSLQLDWDANGEADLAGYLVFYRSESGGDRGAIRAGTQPSALVDGLRMGERYFFTVRAITQSGMTGDASPEVSAVVVRRMQPAPPDPLDPTYPAGTGKLSYFAEGADGGFTYRLALLNTNTEGSTVSATFLREGGQPIVREYALPAQSRVTVSSTDVPELAGATFGAVVSSASGIVVERTMGWDAGGTMTGGHTAKALLAPEKTWYLAEGNVGFFETFILLANPNPEPTRVSVSFLDESGRVLEKSYGLAGYQRLTVHANQFPELLWQSFATTVQADAPILVERAMYFTGGESFFRGGHASAAVLEGAKHWFLAEGQTGAMFSTFVLIANPGAKAAKVTVRYLTNHGVARIDEMTLPPTSRKTIPVDHLPEVAASDVSFDVTANVPIIVERSMYWPDENGPWYGAHNSMGVPELGREWALAEGEVGGPEGAESYILLANPGSSPADTTLTFYREGGLPPLTLTRSVPPNARVTVAASSAGFSSGERFGAVVTSTQPIAVERSIYWNSGGLFWGSGTNETGTRLR